MYKLLILEVNGITYMLLISEGQRCHLYVTQFRSQFHRSTISCIRHSFRKSILWVNDIMNTLLISKVDFIGQRSLWLYHVYVTHWITKVNFTGQRSLQDAISIVYRDRTTVILTSQFAKVTWVIWSLSKNLHRLDWVITRTIEYRLSLS